MNGIISGVCIAIVIAIGAAIYLDRNVQQTADVAFATTGVRL
ncbi:MAG: hypothetical protein ACK53U_11390 [Alphaproteobacteria bacterium]|jgi:hypothetical protein|nr:hypothetical protein [Acetobacteraceae bacterium]MCZ8278180.1 hypothetical protein [Acetobacteraceae bacterium]